MQPWDLEWHEWAANVPESGGRGQVSLLSYVRCQGLFSLLRVSLFSIMDFQHTIKLSQFMIVFMQKPFMLAQLTIVVSQLGFVSSQFTIDDLQRHFATLQ
ncbi:MAG: hypothetical protein CVU00_14360 [Bacteroidetes bacterium HGW-Bacteroidetes-17]|nr:MAG: hypothetical protein CVU00_14360 [Bacteroidetes bacterium HGW-Bacteroidetes-17]